MSHCNGCCGTWAALGFLADALNLILPDLDIEAAEINLRKDLMKNGNGLLAEQVLRLLCTGPQVPEPTWHATVLLQIVELLCNLQLALWVRTV